MEKQAIIQDGITPPEELENEKKASVDLEDHPIKRLSDQAEQKLRDKPDTTENLI